MPSNYSIPAPDEDVLAAVGRAVYNYSYLEWGVIWTVAWLREDTSQVNCLATCDGGRIAAALKTAIADCAPSDVRDDLTVWSEEFEECTKVRNDLLHAHPYTADTETEAQGLWRVRRASPGSFSVAVTADEVHEYARQFDDVSTKGSPLQERLRP